MGEDREVERCCEKFLELKKKFRNFETSLKQSNYKFNTCKTIGIL